MPQLLWTVPTLHDVATKLAVAPSGWYAAFGGPKGIVWLVDLRNRRARPLEPLGAEVAGLAFSADGRYIAAVDDEDRARGRTWSVPSGETTRKWQVPRGADLINSLMPLKGSAFLLVAITGKTYKLSFDGRMRSIAAPPTWVTSAVGPDPGGLIFLGGDYNVSAFQPGSRARLKVWRDDPKDLSYSCVDACPAHDLLVAANGLRLTAWSIRTGAVRWRVNADSMFISSSSVSSSGRYVATTGPDGLRVWSAATGKMLGEWLPQGMVYGARYIPGTERMAVTYTLIAPSFAIPPKPGPLTRFSVMSLPARDPSASSH